MHFPLKRKKNPLTLPSAGQIQAAQHNLFPEKSQRKIFDRMSKIFLNLDGFKNGYVCTMITSNVGLWIWDAQNTHVNEIQMSWANF